jgi:hypothetical protein
MLGNDREMRLHETKVGESKLGCVRQALKRVLALRSDVAQTRSSRKGTTKLATRTRLRRPDSLPIRIGCFVETHDFLIPLSYVDRDEPLKK